MLNFLSLRETGIVDPQHVRRAENTRRAYALELSKYHDTQKIQDGGINTLDIDPIEGRYLLSGGACGVIVVHDLYNTSGEPKCTFPAVATVGRSNRNVHKFSVETVQWYPLDTGMFMSSGMDKLLKVWDTNTLVTADEYEFSGVIYSHDMSQVATKHSLLAIGTQTSKVKLLDLKSGSATHTLKGHKKAVLTVCWSTKDEFLLATGSEDNKVMLWDVRSAKGSLMVLDQHNGDTAASPNSLNTAHNGHINGMKFTGDGQRLLTFGTDEQLRLWSTASGKNTSVNYGRISNESRKRIDLTVSKECIPDLVFVPSDNDIDVYDIYSGMNITTLRGHYNQVNVCLYDSEIHHLYSGGNDRNILLWEPYTETVAAYEDHLHKDDKDMDKSSHSFVRRIGAQDEWSSDED